MTAAATSSAGRPSRRARGFTLLELMIVLVIVGILMAYLLISGGSLFGNARVSEARIRLRALAAIVEEFRTAEGRFPDDRLPAGAAANDINSGAEALFLALFDPAWSGSRPDQDWLVNTDGDESRKALTILPSRELFEIGDPWHNPIAYFENLHYEQEGTVLAGEEEDYEEQQVHARRHPVTSGWLEPGRFQLVSAGLDGRFGTADDLASADG